MPTGTRSSEPVRTGIATSSANSESLSPSSLRIGSPTIANIIQTAKKIVNSTVATTRTRTASGGTWAEVALSRVARACDPGAEGSAGASGGDSVVDTRASFGGGPGAAGPVHTGPHVARRPRAVDDGTAHEVGDRHAPGVDEPRERPDRG